MKATMGGFMMPDFTPIVRLDEESHIYTVQTKLDGPFTVKANVTTVLETLLELEQFNCFVDTTTGKTIPADMVKQAGDFGRAFHKAAKLCMLDRLKEWPSELDHAMAELERWKHEHGIVPVRLEVPGYSKKLDVAGTPDIVCHITKGPYAHDGLNWPDYKTTKIHPTVGPQTWAYEQIDREMSGYKGMGKRWLLEIPKKDGEYKFIELNDPYDEHEFKARNFDFKWRRR